MWRALAVGGLIVFCSGTIFCQSVNIPPAFVIADIHPSPSNKSSVIPKGPFLAGDRFELRSATVLDMIRLAYSPAKAYMVDEDKVVGGPAWLDFDLYDVIAQVPPRSSYESAKLMLRTLLADRFKVAIRDDSAPLPAYALKAGKKLVLREADGAGESGCKRVGAVPAVFAPGATASYSCRNLTMSAFADEMDLIAGGDLTNHRVVDQTGLKGAWNFDFEFAPTRLPGQGGTSFMEALQKQLGLELTLTKVPTPVLVVAGANEKPPPNSPGAAQALPPLPQEFEAATVKPAAPDSPGYHFLVQPGGRVDIHNAPLRTVIMRAWGLDSVRTNSVLIGPKFIDTDRFDIIAKAPTFGLPPDAPAAAAADPRLAASLRFTDNDSINPMLRTLLIQRFGLTFYYAARQMPAFKLTVTKPKLQKADSSHRTGCRLVPGTGAQLPRSITFVCENITMEQFAEVLPRRDFVGQLSGSDGPVTNVIDATGLRGAWDFTVSFTPGGAGGAGAAGTPFNSRGRGTAAGPPAGVTPGLQAADPSGATFFEALEKQVGIKLGKTQVPGTVMVIDHLEQKPKEP
jgi:uncharacterized protein (TIGR03435 family)